VARSLSIRVDTHSSFYSAMHWKSPGHSQCQGRTLSLPQALRCGDRSTCQPQQVRKEGKKHHDPRQSNYRRARRSVT
jgi:hypothetical protein